MDLLLDGQNRARILYRSGVGYRELWMATWDDGWKTELVKTYPVEAYGSMNFTGWLLLDNLGKPVVYSMASDRESGYRRYEIGRFDGLDWNFETILEGTTNALLTRLLLDSRNRAHFIYRDLVTQALYYGIWDESHLKAEALPEGIRPGIWRTGMAFGPGEQLYFVYEEGGDIKLASLQPSSIYLPLVYR